MFKRIDGLLSPQEVHQLREIARAGAFVDGRVSNPHNTAKQNLQLHDPQGAQPAAKIMVDALLRSEEFRDFTFVKRLAPPLLASYRETMHYGLHADAAFMPLGQRSLRADLSCTIFLSDLDAYEGGALHVVLGESAVEFRLPPGSAIVYPSTTLHQVTPVTRGDRLVGLTFIESRIPSPEKRDMLYELNEVSALEGLGMAKENYARLTRVRSNLLRHWAETD